MPIPENSADYSAWDDDEPSDLEEVEPFLSSRPVTNGLSDPLSSGSGRLSQSHALYNQPVYFNLAVTPDQAGERLDKWLATQLSQYSRSRLQQWITAGFVTVNGKAAAPRRAVWPGEKIIVAAQPSNEENAFSAEQIPLNIVYEDATLIVINKPAGLVVHPAAGNWSGTLLNGLLFHAPELALLPRAGIVHRLDKDTTGLMVVARTLIAQTDLVRQLQARTVRREYLAVVLGEPDDAGIVDTPIGRHPRERTKMATFPSSAGFYGRVSDNIPQISGTKPALTRYSVLLRFDWHGIPLALVKCRLETGRTHQIRVHLQSIGLPLIGDSVYGGNRQIVPPISFARQALHAWRLGLIHPQTGEAMIWSSDLPEDLAGLLARLGLDQPLEQLLVAES